MVEARSEWSLFLVTGFGLASRETFNINLYFRNRRLAQGFTMIQ